MGQTIFTNARLLLDGFDLLQPGHEVLVDGRLINKTRVRLRPGALVRIGADGPDLTAASVSAPAADRLSRFLQLRTSTLASLPREVVWELSAVAEQRVPLPDEVLLAAGAIPSVF